MRDYLELTKPRITILIVICTAVGFYFGCRGPIRLAILLHALLGTALMASGTYALNQWYEWATDVKMRRTSKRPIPAGRISRRRAFSFGIALAVAGAVELAIGTNLLAAALGLFTLLSYLLVYTPMKQLSPSCTTVGAIPGAMPPLIGYAAANGGLHPVGFALFLILFVWQFPHFYSIAWIYREDYARGGIRMLPVVQPDGESTARRIMGFALLLIPISVLPRMLGMTGSVYPACAVAAGLVLLYFGVRLGRDRTIARARHVLLATVLYLPAILAVMVIDRRGV